MKKTAIMILSVVMILSVLCSCAVQTKQSGEGDDALVASFKTLGDAINCSDAEEQQKALLGRTYIYVFELKGVYYRLLAALTEEQSDAIFDLDFDDDNYDSKLNDIISPLKVERCENLTKNIPTQEELDKLVGKTGKDLLDDGWTNCGYNLNEMEFWMNHDAYAFTVVMDGKLEDSDDFDAEEAIAPLTVKSITYTGLGDATSVELD